MRNSHKKNLGIVFCLVTLFIFIVGASSWAAAPVPNVSITPSTTVEVGEEVLFDATATTDDASLSSGKFEWDFGDGTGLKPGYPTSSYTDGGIACTHFFTNPGTYTVTLKVIDTSGTSATKTITMNVTGSEPKLAPRPSVSPLVELKFENNVSDTSPNRLTTSMSGTAAYAKGPEGQALNTSTGSYAVVSNNSSLSGMSQFTISFWAKKLSGSTAGFAIEKSGSYGLYLDDVNRLFRSVVTTSSGSVTTNYWLLYEIQNTAWHHFVLTYDGAKVRFYYDGQEVVENIDGKFPQALTGTVAATSSNLTIGKGSSGTVFNGYMDEVKIYNKALTKDELFKGFDLVHANYVAHTDQYIYVKVPGMYTIDSTKRLKVTLTGDNGYSSVMVDKAQPAAEEKFLLTNKNLNAGNYVMTAQLLDSSGAVIEQIRDKFSKSYNGAPKIGIDKNNAIIKNGAPFFPITPWGLSKSELSEWKARKIINTLYVQGFGYDPATYGATTTWLDYLNAAVSYGYGVIGPERWVGKVDSPYGRNSNITGIKDYVTATKDNSGVDMWMWYDEPNMGGKSSYTPAPVVRSWTYKAHMYDDQHPVADNYYGYGYLDPDPSSFDYTGNAPFFGGKGQLIADVVSFDIYPIEYSTFSAFDSPNLVMDNYARAIDNIINWNGNLIPVMSFIESQDIQNPNGAGTPGPTAEQLRMEIWLNITHGMKGLSWFHYWGEIPPENYAVMSETLALTTKLTNVLLGPNSTITVTDGSNVKGNRVDTIVKEDASNIWVFAQRITELDEENNPAGNVTFTVSGLTSTTPVVEPGGDLSQTIRKDMGSSSSQSSFSLNVGEPIVPGSVSVGGYTGGWAYFEDNGNGSLTGIPYSSATMSGTVNYSTGAITLNFGTTVSSGASNLRVFYRPNKADRTVSHSGNTFTDSFAQNQLHIYKIAKGTSTADTTAPSVPTNVAGTAVSSTQVSLSWTASTDNVGVAGYKVFRNGTQVGSATAASYTDSGLTASTTYSYTVAAYDAAGNTSAQSAAVSVTTPSGTVADTTAPSVPTNVAGTAVSNSQVNLTWTASTDNVGVTGYRVYRNGTQVATTTTTAYSVTSLTAATTYSFTVAAYDAAGNTSAQSTAVSVTTPSGTTTDTTAPSVPTNVAGTALSSSNIVLGWTASTDNVGVVGYKVNRSNSSGTVVETQTTPTCNCTGLTASTTYTFTVAAYDAAGNMSSSTAPISVTTPSGSTTTDTTAPSVPANVTAATASSSKANVQWADSTDNVGVAGYKIYRNGALVGSSTIASYTDSGLTAGTSYTYNVAAYDAAGNLSAKSAVAYANTQSSSVTDTSAPSVPTNLAGTAVSSTQVNLTWAASTDNVGVSGYRVYRDGVQIVATTNTSYSATGLTAGTKYKFTVSAYDAARNFSAVSTPIYVTTTGGTPIPVGDTTAPSVPTGLVGSSSSSSQINLSWTASTDNVGVTGYRVYRNGTLIGTVSFASYSDLGLTASTTYSYTIAAYDAAGNISGQSTAVSVTTKAAASTTDTTAPSVPTNLAGTAISTSQINLTWSPSTDNVGVDGYRVYKNGVQIVATKGNSYSVTGLTSGTSYKFQVSAYDVARNFSALSAPIYVITK